MTLVISVFEQGMIYAIMALGMYITYKILDFPDMTVDGSFPLGASLSAVLISQGMNPYLTLLLSFAAGLMAGTITGLIHVKLKVRDILASIIMMTALYSVNLRIAGKANLPIYNYYNIYNNSLTNHLLGGALSPYKNLIIIAIIVVIVKCVLDWYLKTKSGYLLKAVGDNETLVTSMWIDKGKIKILGLAIANGLFPSVAPCSPSSSVFLMHLWVLEPQSLVWHRSSLEQHFSDRSAFLDFLSA